MSGPWLAVLYLIVLLAPLGLAVLSGLEPVGSWREAAAAVGIVAGVAMMLQFVTSGRFEALSGRIGIDVTMAFHKWLARALLLVVILHPILYVASDVFTDPAGAWATLVHMLVARRYHSGVVALVVVVVITVMALTRNRLPLRYEAWRGTHGVLALVTAGLVVIHALRVGSYSREWPLETVWPLLAAVVMASALIVYALRTYRMQTAPWRVVRVDNVARGLWELTVRPERGGGLAYRAGQFAWIALAPRRFPLFDHPFSIASAPARGPDLSFVIKEAGDFTDRIGALAPGTLVGLDAPHGSFVPDELPRAALVLVAGGVGIAPILGIIRDLAARGDRRKVRLVYGAATPHGMIAPERILAEAGTLDFQAVFLAETAGPDWPHETGRISREIVARLLDEVDAKTTGAMLCGPGPMMCAACDLLHEAGVPLGAIRYERFDYADGARSAKDRRMLAGFAAMAAAVVAAVLAFAWR